MSSIRIRDLTRSFGGRRALDGVTLDIEEGEMVALIGASGSGKSTLLRHIAGLTTADRGSRGTVHVGGRPVQLDGRLSRDVRSLRARIGFVFQQFNLVGRMPVMTNVLAGLLHEIPAWRTTLRRFTHAEIERGFEALDRVGIVQQAWQRASTLSGGQQQRAAIARTLVQGAKAILADEPIASLDPESSRRVMDILSVINRQDRATVVVSLHQVQVALKYCPRTIALHEGRVVHDGPSNRLTPERLRQIYGADLDELLPHANVREPAADPIPFPVFQPAGEKLTAAARMCA